MDLAPRSRRVFLYAVAAVDDALQDGEQQPTQVGRVRVRLPLVLTQVDRRYLRLVPGGVGFPRLATAYPGHAVAWRLTRSERARADGASASNDAWGDSDSDT